MRVLVIDDDQGVRSLLHHALTGEGWDVVAAPTGVEGLRLALAGGFSLVVLDLGLPDLHGTAVLGALHEQRPEQRVMVLSAASGVDDRIVCFERGAVDFVPKPFAMRELLLRVRTRLVEPAAPAGASAATGGEVLTAGGITLDVGRRRVVMGERAVDLSPREFRLLEHLMRRGGRVCRREELLEEVWGYADAHASNVVDVTMRRLRRKLGNPDALETVRHVGYSIA